MPETSHKPTKGRYTKSNPQGEPSRNDKRGSGRAQTPRQALHNEYKKNQQAANSYRKDLEDQASLQKKVKRLKAFVEERASEIRKRKLFNDVYIAGEGSGRAGKRSQGHQGINEYIDGAEIDLANALGDLNSYETRLGMPRTTLLPTDSVSAYQEHNITREMNDAKADMRMLSDQDGLEEPLETINSRDSTFSSQPLSTIDSWASGCSDDYYKTSQDYESQELYDDSGIDPEEDGCGSWEHQEDSIEQHERIEEEYTPAAGGSCNQLTERDLHRLKSGKHFRPLK